MFLRKAIPSDSERIWEILQDGIESRRLEGSLQWQDGYPNPEIIVADIQKEIGFVAVENEQIVGYIVIIHGVEEAYNSIDGNWLTNGEYVVLHRLATAKEFKNQGVATKIMQLVEESCRKEKIPSIRVDTNFDNAAMLHVFKKLDYEYCGEVLLRDAPRKAFEKILN